MKQSTGLFLLTALAAFAALVSVSGAGYLLVLAITLIPHAQIAPGVQVGDWSSAYWAVPLFVGAVAVWMVGLWLYGIAKWAYHKGVQQSQEATVDLEAGARRMNRNQHAVTRVVRQGHSPGLATIGFETVLGGFRSHLPDCSLVEWDYHDAVRFADWVHVKKQKLDEGRSQGQSRSELDEVGPRTLDVLVAAAFGFRFWVMPANNMIAGVAPGDADPWDHFKPEFRAEERARYESFAVNDYREDVHGPRTLGVPEYSRDLTAATQLWRERIGGDGTRMWLRDGLFGFEINRKDGYGRAEHELLGTAICRAALAWMACRGFDSFLPSARKVETP